MKFKNPAAIRSTHLDTPLGGITLAATDAGLAGLWFDAQRHAPEMTGWQPAADHPVLREAAQQVSD